MFPGMEIKPPRSSILAELILEAMSPNGPGWSELVKRQIFLLEGMLTMLPRVSLIGSSGVGAAMATATKSAVKMVEKRMMYDVWVMSAVGGLSEGDIIEA